MNLDYGPERASGRVFDRCFVTAHLTTHQWLVGGPLRCACSSGARAGATRSFQRALPEAPRGFMPAQQRIPASRRSNICTAAALQPPARASWRSAAALHVTPYRATAHCRSAAARAARGAAPPPAAARPTASDALRTRCPARVAAAAREHASARCSRGGVPPRARAPSASIAAAQNGSVEPGMRPKCWRLMSALCRARASFMSRTPVATRVPALSPDPATSSPSRSTKVPLPRARSPGLRGSVCAAQRTQSSAYMRGEDACACVHHRRAAPALVFPMTATQRPHATHHAQEANARPKALELL